jgi:hypothetical protein
VLVIGAAIVFSLCATLAALRLSALDDRSEPAAPGWYRGESEAEASTEAEAADTAARAAARADAQEAETG